MHAHTYTHMHTYAHTRTHSLTHLYDDNLAGSQEGQ
jgi:hypothetical protein